MGPQPIWAKSNRSGRVLTNRSRKISSHGYHLCFRKQYGYFPTIRLTGAVKQREPTRKPENAAISVPERNISSLPMRLENAEMQPSCFSLLILIWPCLRSDTYWRRTIFSIPSLVNSVTSQRGSNKPHCHWIKKLKKRINKKRRSDTPSSLAYRPGRYLPFMGFLSGPSLL